MVFHVKILCPRWFDLFCSSFYWLSLITRISSDTQLDQFVSLCSLIQNINLTNERHHFLEYHSWWALLGQLGWNICMCVLLFIWQIIIALFNFWLLDAWCKIHSCVWWCSKFTILFVELMFTNGVTKYFTTIARGSGVCYHQALWIKILLHSPFFVRQSEKRLYFGLRAPSRISISLTLCLSLLPHGVQCSTCMSVKACFR